MSRAPLRGRGVRGKPHDIGRARPLPDGTSRRSQWSSRAGARAYGTRRLRARVDAVNVLLAERAFSREFRRPRPERPPPPSPRGDARRPRPAPRPRRRRSGRGGARRSRRPTPSTRRSSSRTRSPRRRRLPGCSAARSASASGPVRFVVLVRTRTSGSTSGPSTSTATTSTARDNEAWAIGGWLEYTSGWLANVFQVGATGLHVAAALRARGPRRHVAPRAGPGGDHRPRTRRSRACAGATTPSSRRTARS